MYKVQVQSTLLTKNILQSFIAINRLNINYYTLYTRNKSKDGIEFQRQKMDMCEKQKNKINPLPNYKISDRFKLKAIADDKIEITKKLEFVSSRLENIENIVWRCNTPSTLKNQVEL